MTRLFDFSLDTHGLDDVRFLIKRDDLPCNGDIESTFFDGIRNLRRHPGSLKIATALGQLAAQCEIVVIVRNADLVLDCDLPQRISQTIASLSTVGDWALAGPGGLGLQDERHLAIYASGNPAIPQYAGLQPLVDLMPDIYMVSAEFIRSLPMRMLANLDTALEPALAAQGYLDGRVSVFTPDLTVGIDGDLLARDLADVTSELSQTFRDRLSGQSIATLSGPIRTTMSDASSTSNQRTSDLQQAIQSCVTVRADTPSISLVTRTRFDRPHLLRRMLTSVSRARRDDMPFEVVLSTDTDPAMAEATFAELQQDFVNLKLRLKLNPAGGHSRVTNLLGGVQVASGEYVLFVDDDDYVDIFAFDAMRTACFCGNRPVVALTSQVHEESWEKTPSGRWVLTHSAQMNSYPASGWRDMFTGVNKLPICGLLFPRQRLRARLRDFPLRHDLSEDYALFLLTLTDPELPAIHECSEPVVHISIRGSENSVLMPDRRPWVQDITRFLADLTQANAVAGAGQWALFTQAASRTDRPDPAEATEHEALLERRNQEIRLLREEVKRLRAEDVRIGERAA